MVRKREERGETRKRGDEEREKKWGTNNEVPMTNNRKSEKLTTPSKWSKLASCYMAIDVKHVSAKTVAGNDTHWV